MHPYLENTTAATSLLFDELAKEQIDLDELMRRTTAVYIKRTSGGRINPSDYARMSPEEINNWTARYMRDIGTLHAAADQVSMRIRDRHFSLGVLAGAILQMARQGISWRWGGYDQAKGCPRVRDIRNNPALPIAKVVFAGRNQALHFEEEAMRKEPTQDVLDALGLLHAPEKNLARDFLAILEWRDYDSYLKDMQQLLPA
jgi:hypothetical protein